mgnify:CR=1 FL=1
MKGENRQTLAIKTLDKLGMHVDLRELLHGKIPTKNSVTIAAISSANCLKSLIHCCRLSNISVSSLLCMRF